MSQASLSCSRACRSCIACAVDGLRACEDDDVLGLPFARLGARGLFVGGRIRLHPVVVSDLSSLFRRSGGIVSLRFPSFWWCVVQMWIGSSHKLVGCLSGTRLLCEVRECVSSSCVEKLSARNVFFCKRLLSDSKSLLACRRAELRRTSRR